MVASSFSRVTSGKASSHRRKRAPPLATPVLQLALPSPLAAHEQPCQPHTSLSHQSRARCSLSAPADACPPAVIESRAPRPRAVVALHQITSPALGSPHMHLRMPWASRFVGEASPADQPVQYVACVSALLAAYRASPSACRHGLIINTCGWVRSFAARPPPHHPLLLGPQHSFGVCSEAHRVPARAHGAGEWVGWSASRRHRRRGRTDSLGAAGGCWPHDTIACRAACRPVSSSRSGGCGCCCRRAHHSPVGAVASGWWWRRS